MAHHHPDDQAHSPTSACLCRQVTNGSETLAKMENVETTTSGIFVMPKQRIEITSTYVVDDPCMGSVRRLQDRLEAMTSQLEVTRNRKLP